MGKIGISILTRKCADFRMVIRYKSIEELSNEETANERSANKVCIFTNKARQLEQYKLGRVWCSGEKASGTDCKGSKGKEVW